MALIAADELQSLLETAPLNSSHKSTPAHSSPIQPVIALIGYTNAGITSLMNALTSAGLSARDLPFETLDTTTRVLARQAGCEVLHSDTVGFIRNLPQRLVASFESTLAETLEADLLVIVTDVSDPECELHMQTTEAMLEQLSRSNSTFLCVQQMRQARAACLRFAMQCLEPWQRVFAHPYTRSNSDVRIDAASNRSGERPVDTPTLFVKCSISALTP